MELNLEKVEMLLLVAAFVAVAANRLRLPYTVGLVLAGIALAVLQRVGVPLPEMPLTRQLVFNILLPPLVFEAAFYIEWRELRRDLGIIMVLATIGVVLATGVVAVGLHGAAGWAWPAALLFGVLIAATDPVSVIATFKEAGATGRLRLLVEAESLFNDGTAAVGFAIAVAAMTVGAPTALGILSALGINLVFSLLVGIIVGALAVLGIGRTDDHLVEISFTSVAAFGSFWLADHFHFSGVLATLSAGLLVGNRGRLGALSNKGREAVDAFWEYAAFVANSMIFLLIGIHLHSQDFAGNGAVALLAILLVLAGRAVAVYPLCALFVKSAQRISRPHQHILFWGGLRGALALGLVLGLPNDMPQRPVIESTAFAVVAFSIIVQGITIKPLLRRLEHD